MLSCFCGREVSHLPLCYISHKAIYDTTSHYTIGAVGSLIGLYILCPGAGSVLFGARYLYGGAGGFYYKHPCFTAVGVMAGVCAVHSEWGQGASVVLRRAVQEVRYS